MFNDSYRDYSDVTFVRSATEYDFDDVLVVDRDWFVSAARIIIAHENIRCRVDNKLWDIERIEWSNTLGMVKITAKESDDAFWFSQPDDYIFYDDRGARFIRSR